MSSLELFKVRFAAAQVEALRKRLSESVIAPAPDDDRDWHYGTDARYLAEFRDYWVDTYDFVAAEARFNRFPQYRTVIDGIPVHFYYVLSKTSRSFPLILTHGWPGSVAEFHAAIEPLSEAGFDLVIPSLPGFGFSGAPARPIGPRQVARMWRTLMVDRLGYSRFGAQGGDWGSAVSAALAHDHADVVAALHLNLLFTYAVKDDSHEASAWREERGRIMAQEGAYSQLHRTKPQTIALALSDTPIGFAAWVLEKCRSWSDCGGNLENRFSKDQLIDNIMTYVATGNIGSAIWMYHGSTIEAPIDGRIDVPTAFARFPGEFVPPPPRATADRMYAIGRWTEMAAGGHFGAWEEPAAFAAEVATFFAAFRE